MFPPGYKAPIAPNKPMKGKKKKAKKLLKTEQITEEIKEDGLFYTGAIPIAQIKADRAAKDKEAIENDPQQDEKLIIQQIMKDKSKQYLEESKRADKAKQD